MTMKEFKRYIKQAIQVKQTIVNAYMKSSSCSGADCIRQKAKLEELKDIQKVIES